jgi:hypothetical protein
MLDHKSNGIIAEGAPAELAATSADPRVRDFLSQNNYLPRRKGENSAEGGKLNTK